MVLRQQLVQRDRQVADADAGRMIDGVRDSSGADDPDKVLDESREAGQDGSMRAT